MLFSSECSLGLVKELDITYKEIKIKQYKHVIYLRCVLDETMLGETMALTVVEKINSRLKFLYQKNRYLYVPLHKLLCNTLIKPPWIMPVLLGTQYWQRN